MYLRCRNIPDLGDHEHHVTLDTLQLSSVDVLRYTRGANILQVQVQCLDYRIYRYVIVQGVSEKSAI